MLVSERKAATFCWRLTLIWTAIAVTGTMSNEAALYEDLFSKYRPTVRPRLLPTQKVDVFLQFELKMIKDLDEKNEVLHTVGYIVSTWKDDFLKWNPANYSGVKHVVVQADKVWLPDFGIENSAEDLYKESYFKLFRVSIDNHGNVAWAFGGVFHTTCDLDITYYPFDDQECYIRLENWMYSQKSVDLHNTSSEVMVGKYQENGLWDLTETRAAKDQVFYDTNPGVPYARVRYMLTLRRKPRYYVVNIVVPCILISAVTLLVYLLPPESGEKVSLGVTVLLAFSVFLFVIAENTPVTSDSTPILGIFIAMSMGMSTVSVITTVVVLYLHHHHESCGPPAWLRLVAFNVIGRFLWVRVPALPEVHPEQQRQRPNGSSPLLVRTDKNGERNARNATSELEQDTTTVDDCFTSAVHSYLDEINAQLRRITAHHSTVQAKQSKRDTHAAIGEEWKAVARVVDRLLLLITLVVTVAIVIWLLKTGLHHQSKQAD